MATDERLLIADRGQNRLLVINPNTDKSKIINIPLVSPRGIALDTDINSAVFAYVAEQTRVLKFPVYRTVFVSAWVAKGAPISEQEVRRYVEIANRTLAKCGFEVQLRDNKVNFFDAASLLDLEINDWANTFCNNTSPPLLRTTEESLLVDSPIRRSSTSTDINVYFVRSLTIAGGGVARSIAETVTEDCFTNEPMSDSSNSGIIVSAQRLRQYRRQLERTLAHELGHAMLDIFFWGDEHTDENGGALPPTNVMGVPPSAVRRGFERPQQCQSINDDRTIFRGDP